MFLQLTQTPRGVFAFWPIKYIAMNFVENKFYSQEKRENFTRHAVKMEFDRGKTFRLGIFHGIHSLISNAVYQEVLHFVNQITNKR